jgi:S1/P1 Nuclease
MFPRIPCSESRFGGIGNALKHESSIGEETEKVIYTFTAYHLRTMGRRFLTFCFVALALFLHPLPAVAWGYQGHRMIADIAMDHLTPEARQSLRELLRDNDLASISTWADDIKNDRPETKPWHYVDIPSTAAGYLAARDCAAGDCVVAKIEQFEAVCRIEVSRFKHVRKRSNIWFTSSAMFTSHSTRSPMVEAAMMWPFLNLVCRLVATIHVNYMEPGIRI